MSNIQLYNGDCLKIMQNIPNDSIDLILCDLPYGTVKGLKLEGQNLNPYKWDVLIPLEPLFKEYERIIKIGGKIILFSQEPFTNQLRSFKSENINFCYPLIWIKNNFANYLSCNKAPVSYFEDLSVFSKRYNRYNNPLRDYAKYLFEYIGISKAEINKKLGHRRAEHFFRYDSMQFELCTAETYKELEEKFKINKARGYKKFDELKKINSFFKTSNAPVFNLNGNKHKSNVLTYSKEAKSFHPTQKPTALLEDLILTYTNAEATILDNCMGSGSTGVACKNLNRNFIGIELDEKYYQIAKERIGI